jgi:hypothetical protein
MATVVAGGERMLRTTDQHELFMPEQVNGQPAQPAAVSRNQPRPRSISFTPARAAMNVSGRLTADWVTPCRLAVMLKFWFRQDHKKPRSPRLHEVKE